MLPIIPENLPDWSINTINELIKYIGIESETFDFKKELNELEEHVCAMANTKGGFLVLGINEVKSNDGARTIKFEKTGFDNGKEDGINNRITEALLLVDPKPPVETKQIEENEKFYVVIKIQNKISNYVDFLVINAVNPTPRSIAPNSMKKFPIFSGFVSASEIKNTVKPIIKKAIPKQRQKVETFLSCLCDNNISNMI
ncbi:MAG: AlbA family DNA-binding domain-containing protein [Nitrosarchaeum sp.]